MCDGILLNCRQQTTKKKQQKPPTIFRIVPILFACIENDTFSSCCCCYRRRRHYRVCMNDRSKCQLPQWYLIYSICRLVACCCSTTNVVVAFQIKYQKSLFFSYVLQCQPIWCSLSMYSCACDAEICMTEWVGDDGIFYGNPFYYIHGYCWCCVKVHFVSMDLWMFCIPIDFETGTKDGSSHIDSYSSYSCISTHIHTYTVYYTHTHREYCRESPIMLLLVLK